MDFMIFPIPPLNKVKCRHTCHGSDMLVGLQLVYGNVEVGVGLTVMISLKILWSGGRLQGGSVFRFEAKSSKNNRNTPSKLQLKVHSCSGRFPQFLVTYYCQLLEFK
ncbi:hypothetical protein CHARACLAT_032568 [Characodon lateralis]|uniref:Uncharacterized protein n=1 Tax=Characodon lateralis TaxID=208331 RepID=A0ABU7EQJ3_9TELE|nr:hypothetical protein [Characodon lateralis]